MKDAIECMRTFFEIDNNTTATILITITVFLIGVFIRGAFLLIVNYVRRCRHRKMFIYILNEISKSISKKGEYLIEVSKKLTISHIGDLYISTLPIKYLTVIERIDFIDTYNSFFHGIENSYVKKKIEAFSSAQDIIMRTISIEKMLPENINTFRNKFSDYEKNFHDTVEKIRQHYDKCLLIKEIEGEYVSENFLLEMDDIIFSLQQTEDMTHYSIIYMKMIIPLNKLFKKEEYKRFMLKYSDMVNMLIRAEYYYINLESLFNEYSKVFYDSGITYRNNKKLLDLIIKKLNKKSAIFVFSFFTGH